MAKDKTKAAGNDDFAKPSEAPAGGDSWSLIDGTEPKSGSNVDRLMLFTPLRKETTDVTRGKKTESVEIIVADVVLIDEKKPAKSEEHLDVWVFPKWIQGALRGFVRERKVLGRLRKVDDAASAVGYHWELEDVGAEETAAAKAYLASVDPFAQKSAAKKAKDADEADDEKPAKKKDKGAKKKAA
jgi:hypothetical protein